MVSHHSSSDDVQLKKNSTGFIDGSQGFARCSSSVLKSDWLPKLVEPQPSKNFGSNEPWDLGLLWEPVLYWYTIN